ncbi:MAG: hypothetical protein J6V44_07625 [Methanobrevibacter sp.]|nr:hypothetical protein [Methanobrevibacter sp.]
MANTRAINGTNFDGTADITTARWGTARTISISGTAGTTGTSINGSANATLTIPTTLSGFTKITSSEFVGALTGNATSATTANQAIKVSFAYDRDTSNYKDIALIYKADGSTV